MKDVLFFRIVVIAQGGLDTPDGRWFAYLFEDCGAVGRIPYLVPVEWKDGWLFWCGWTCSC